MTAHESIPAHLWQPEIINAATPEGEHVLERLVTAPTTVVCDTLALQVDDLLASRHPDMDAAGRAVLAREMLGKGPSWRAGRWVHYPWSCILVHALPPAELREARLARNQHKITADEQARLLGRTIGIVGLSVGSLIARTLVMEGVCGRLRLADRDTVALSNLNRLPAALPDLAMPKVLLAARVLYELDPYLDIEIHAEGVAADAVDEFLLDGGPLDLVVEECDDMALKIHLRERARELGIPVIMETSEGGILDVERFDLESGRPILHGLLGGVRPEDVRDADAVKELIIRLLPDMRPRTRRSVAEVGVTLRSWPQLASEIALGAATVTTAARKILLGEAMPSGRYRVDLDAVLAAPPALGHSQTEV